MHRDRMRNIGKVAIPREGTFEWEMLQQLIKRNENDPFIQERTKKIFKSARANCVVQELNGAGLPADNMLREYNKEYNNRVFLHSLHQLPSSFNVVEAFNTFLPPSATFKINNEVDCLFSFNDFLDFVTSEECPDSIDNLHHYVKDEVIYSFNSVDDPSASLFSTSSNEEFGVLSVSLVKHKSEVSVLMLAGQKCNLGTKSEELIKTFNNEQGDYLNRILPDESLEVEAVPLLPNSDLWKTIVLARFDLASSTVDARYIFQDAGRSFIGSTDDLDCYIDYEGKFHSSKFEDSYNAQCVKIEEYSALFEICKTSLFLPFFRCEYEDTISIERHPTEYGLTKNKVSFKKFDKHAASDMKIAFRNVENIQPVNRKPPFQGKFLAPELRVESSGYWKKLDFNARGEDKNGQPIQGRTWVNKTLEWKESSKKPVFVNIVPDLVNRQNEGYIYVMQSAAHDKNVFKVGLTRRSPEKRASELSKSTSSPVHFHVVQDWHVADCVLAERLIHEKLVEYRFNPNREYFKAPYKLIFKVIDEVIDSLGGSL